MKRYAIILLALCLLCPLGADAQRKKAKKNATPAVVEDPRIQQMLVSTQKVVFIDSMVVGKNDFMRYIPLSRDAGFLEQTDSMGQFTNELKDHRFTTVFDVNDSACHIVQSDYIERRSKCQSRFFVQRFINESACQKITRELCRDDIITLFKGMIPWSR